MAFIDTIPASDADEETREMYARQERHYGYLPNYAKVFSHRPEIMRLWAQLLSGVKRNMDKRRYELVTFVAANALRSTLCSLAHGKALAEFLPEEDVADVARGVLPGSVTAAEAVMMAYARKVALDASATTSEDVRQLRQHGFSDAEVFDIAAVSAARAFWTKVLDALGVEADARALEMSPAFRAALSVGRPVDFSSSAAGLHSTRCEASP